MFVPGHSMDYPGEQAAAKNKLAHDDLNCGSISGKDSTMWRSVNSITNKSVSGV